MVLSLANKVAPRVTARPFGWLPLRKGAVASSGSHGWTVRMTYGAA